jgi:hypothetical protein
MILKKQIVAKPQDIVILLKIISCKSRKYVCNTVILSRELYISQSEISESLSRSVYIGFIDQKKTEIFRNALYEFIIHGLKYSFPARPGYMERGIPTAHSAPPLSYIIHANEKYVWADPFGSVRGFVIEPLYKTVPKAVKEDEYLYELLALTDALRVGKARERKLADEELFKRIIEGAF